MFKESEYLRLREHVKMDRLEIDRELMENPFVLLEAIEHRSAAEEIRDNAKNNVATTTSLAAIELRDTPVGDKEKQRAEAQIASELPSVPEVFEAKNALVATELDLSLWDGLVTAIHAKGFSLKSLADLSIAGFLAPNSGTQQRREEISEVRNAKARRRVVPE